MYVTVVNVILFGIPFGVAGGGKGTLQIDCIGHSVLGEP